LRRVWWLLRLEWRWRGPWPRRGRRGNAFSLQVDDEESMVNCLCMLKSSSSGGIYTPAYCELWSSWSCKNQDVCAQLRRLHEFFPQYRKRIMRLYCTPQKESEMRYCRQGFGRIMLPRGWRVDVTPHVNGRSSRGLLWRWDILPRTASFAIISTVEFLLRFVSGLPRWFLTLDGSTTYFEDEETLWPGSLIPKTTSHRTMNSDPCRLWLDAPSQFQTPLIVRSEGCLTEPIWGVVSIVCTSV
jgi:hypothetical protein